MLLRLFFGAIIVLIGLAIAGFGVFLAIEPIDWTTRAGVLITVFLFGLAIAVGGVGIIRGEEMGEYFVGLFRHLR